MYESQFRLMRRPFAATPDPRCFLSAEPVQAALDELVVCVEQGQGIAIVSAPAGAGKTLLCERLRTELDDRFEMVFLHHASFLTRRALLQTILCDLNHTYRRHDEQELRLELIPAIRSLNPRREALVLICDEAHQLTEDLLEELRILSDLAENGRPLVRLVLVGQHALEETLARPSMEALNQRIRAHICLETFDRATSLDYIDYRITWGGGRTDEVFTAEALELICRASEGVPRRINQLCDHTLLLAYVAEQTPVTIETVQEALQDLRQLPLHWNESLIPDFSTSQDEGVIEVPVQSVVSWESSAIDPEMDSIEIGADLPEHDSATKSISDVDTSHLKSGIVFVEPESSSPTEDESTPESDVSEPTSFEEEEPLRFIRKPTTQSFISKSSSTVAMFGTTLAEAQRYSNRSRPRSTNVVEEIVWDKYAAIDGGFTLPPAPVIESVIPAEYESAEAVNDGDTPNVDQVQIDLPVERNIEEPAIQRALASIDPNDDPISDGFDAVCERLNGWLPEIDETPAWNRQSLGITALSPETMTMTPDCCHESLEVQLGLAVSEMVNDVRSHVHRIDAKEAETTPLEAVLESVDAVPIEVAGPVADPLLRERQIAETAEENIPETIGSGESSVETIATPPESPRGRPFRYLFSTLRRKQQGLL